MQCPCHSGKEYSGCCEPFHKEILINYRLADFVRIFDSGKFGDER
ncbi:MAG: hypothetical protein S4CHLAM81_07750 [Chlamydiales bacterium]|nr:hypothetical protein [Chlamydiales bacterium]MCH9635557.1 hypothetical protein [Chlamydiales bacterium]